MTKEQLEEEGYYSLKKINGEWCGLCRFIFTTGLVVGIDATGYKYRYCFSNHADAVESLSKYENLSEFPSGNWIKRKGKGGDLRNENYKESG